MSSIQELERELYRECFTAVDAYRQHSPGGQHVPLFLDMARVSPELPFPGSVLDAGSGTGAGSRALHERGFSVTSLDLEDWRDADLQESVTVPFVQACLWDDVRRIVGWRDYVYCCDVLEHIPPEYTMLVVARLLAVARKGCFFSIATRPDAMGVWVGQPLHKTVRSFVWWRDNLGAIGRVEECRDLLGTGLYWVVPCSTKP